MVHHCINDAMTMQQLSLIKNDNSMILLWCDNQFLVKSTKSTMFYQTFHFYALNQMTEVSHTPTTCDSWSCILFFAIVVNWQKIKKHNHNSFHPILWGLSRSLFFKGNTTMSMTTDLAVHGDSCFQATSHSGSCDYTHKCSLQACCYGWGGGYIAGGVCHGTVPTTNNHQLKLFLVSWKTY